MAKETKKNASAATTEGEHCFRRKKSVEFWVIAIQGKVAAVTSSLTKVTKYWTDYATKMGAVMKLDDI